MFPSRRFVTGLVSFQCVASTSSPSSEATIPYRPSMSADPPSCNNSATFSSQIPGNDPPTISHAARLPSSPMASNPVHSQSSSPDQPLVMVGTAAAAAAAAAASSPDPALSLPPERMGSISPSSSSPSSLSTTAPFLGGDKANIFNGGTCVREMSELPDSTSFYAQPFLKTHNSHMEKIQYYSSPATSQPVANFQQQQQQAAAAAMAAAAAAAAAQMVYVDPYAPPAIVWPPQQVVQPTLYIPGSPQEDFGHNPHYQHVQMQQPQLYAQTTMSPTAASFIPASPAQPVSAPAQPVSAPDPVSGSVERRRGPLFSETIVHQYLAEPTQP